jgi:hypothetical protein
MMLNNHLDRLDENSANASSHEDDSKSDSLSRSRSTSNSGIDSSLSDSHATSNTKLSAAEAEIIAAKVSKQVFWLKVAVICVLLAATVLVGVAIYLSTHRSEVDTFESAFADHATKVFDTFQFNVERKLGAIDALSVAITSLAVDINTTWPFFNLPDFAFRAANTRELADAASIALLPFVTVENREEWEAYSIENDQWLEDSQAFEDSSVARQRQLENPTYVNGISAEIYVINSDKQKEVDESIGPFFPFWQHSPLLDQIVNYDLYSNSNFKGGIDTMLESKQAVIGKVWDVVENPEDLIIFDKFDDAWKRNSIPAGQNPISKVFYPVFDTLESDHQIVAMLTGVIDWVTYFDQILPPHANGIVCVLENECGQVHTYQINGEHAEYIGKGDLHRTHYDYLGASIRFDELIKADNRRVERYDNVTLNDDYCVYTLRVYPSEELEDDFVTNNAIIYTVCVVLIFAFTGAVFLIYDCIVERRQKLVMKRAVQSRAIVSSLFPAAVRDRLFKNDDSTGSKNKGDGNAKGFKKRTDASKTRLKSFLHESSPEEQKPAHQLRPIADLFPHTTVMFADIAGFTRWSSERDPAHVFTLLQTVYHAFDRIAKKRRGKFHEEE